MNTLSTIKSNYSSKLLFLLNSSLCPLANGMHVSSWPCTWDDTFLGFILHRQRQPMSLASRRSLRWRIRRTLSDAPSGRLPQAGQARPRVTLGGMNTPGRPTAAVVKFWLGLDATSSKFLDFRETI